MRGDRSWWKFIRTAKTPELPVVLLEDLGALAGLVFALAGVALAVVLEEPRFDAIGSLAIGCLLVVIATILVIEMKSLLMGESASPETIAEIRNIIEETEGVSRLIHMRTEHIGPEELLVGAKIELDSSLDMKGLAKVINTAETRLRDRIPIVKVIYLEPDVFDDANKVA